VIIHHKWSQEFFIPFPETDPTPFTFLGLNWNPGGHPPDSVWTEPHFDIHFHMLPADVVDAITGPTAPTYDLPVRYIPEGYVRGPVVDERVITDMGEHMVAPPYPEMNGGTFTNTLIWGAYDPDGDDIAELSFVEPMITQAYLREHSDTDRRRIAQPATYARDGVYPTAYAVRDVPKATESPSPSRTSSDATGTTNGKNLSVAASPVKSVLWYTFSLYGKPLLAFPLQIYSRCADYRVRINHQVHRNFATRIRLSDRQPNHYQGLNP